MKRAFLFGVILSALIGSASSAMVLRVPGEYPSIQQAITDANDGDTVLVSPGVYYETINFGGKDITVTSTDPNDRGIVGYTILNADGDGTVVTFENGETNKAVLAGFTLTGGVGTVAYQYNSSTYRYMQVNGAGIYCKYNASPTITRCVITRNHAPYYQRNDGNMSEYAYSYGGGIYCEGYRAVITHNVVYNNSAGYGGGIYASNSATISNNVVYNNSAAHGGGIYSGYCNLFNNTIVNNDVSKSPESGRGGNVYVYFDYGMESVLVNNIICGAKSGGGIFFRQAHDDVIRFNNVWDNSPANYVMEDPRTNGIVSGGKADWTGRSGNISANPRFRNPSMNDFHLQAESPCISEGDPNSHRRLPAQDIDGDPRVYALHVDMGADEFIGYVKPLANAGSDQHKLTPEAITLDGGNSYFSDPDAAKTYQWRQVQGTPVELSDAAAQTPVFTPPAEGWYVFELVVGDGQYTSKPDRTLVVIGNEAPVANAGPDAMWQVPDFVLLDGSGSSDVDPPDQLTYTWRQIEGPPASFYQFTPEQMELYGIDGGTSYVQCPQPGIYVFELVVSDGFTTSAPDTVKIEGTSFTVKETEIDVVKSGTDYFQYPVVSGSKVVYSEGEYIDSTWSIRCTDLETGRVDTLQSQPTDTMPDVDGDYIVWTTGPEGYYKLIRTSVVVGDLSTGLVHNLRMQSGTDSYGYPALSGTKAVWLHHRGVSTANEDQYGQAAYDICGADISDPAKPVYFTIVEQAGHGLPYPYQDIRETYESPVDICGNLVVWEADGDIYGADLSDLQRIRVFPICTAPESQSDPAISGHTVVWTDQRDDVGDIYGADISDPNHVREFVVYASPGPQTQPDIDGAMVAFVAASSYSTGSIELYCLSREYGPVRVNFSGWYYGARPRLDGSTLIWHYYDQVQGLTFDFGYGLTTGPVQNITTGTHYDYIQHAIDTAGQGDTLVVQPGVYEEKIRFKGKSVTLTSTEPEDLAVRAATVIAGPGQQVTFMDDETSDCVFTGFTVSGGSYGAFCGGSAPTIDRCTITNASYTGVKVWNKGVPTLTRCDIVGNATGVEMWAHREKRLVLNNFGTFRNCLVVRNRQAGFYSGYPTLENCTVADNLGLGVDVILANITNSILYFNNEGADGVNLKVEKATSVVTYSDVQGGWQGEGNLDADPLFLARGQWIATGSVPIGTGRRVSIQPGVPDWASGDYHLKSQGWSWNGLQGIWAWDDATSPCIDAGDPAASIGDEPPCAAGDPLSDRAGVNTRIDMGAYGGTVEASLAPHAPAPQP
jgi:beta propeller repeat protein